jgi:hypothetical protein
LLAVVSLIISLLALAISSGRLIRRPKISAFWKEDDPSDGFHQPMEYIEIVVTARQRGLDLREIGLLSLKGRPPLLRHLDEATLLTDMPAQRLRDTANPRPGHLRRRLLHPALATTAVAHTPRRTPTNQRRDPALDPRPPDCGS